MKAAARHRTRRRLLGGQSRVARVVRGTLYVKLCLVLIVGVTVGVLYLRLSAGPLTFGRLAERVADAISVRLGPGWSVAMRNTAVMLEDGSPALRATELDIRNPDGGLVLRAPLAVISVDGLSLLTANLQPRSIAFRGLQLRALLNRDGSLTFVPPPEEGSAVAPGPPRPAASDPGAPSPVSVALGSLFDLLIGSNGVIGSLDRAEVAEASLTVVDEAGRERATFPRLDATFARTETGGRRFDAAFEGPQGHWRISGEAAADSDGGYRATMTATDAPVQDLLLLSGFSGIPATTDLKLSGRVEAAVAGGRTQVLTARLTSNAGRIQIHDKDTSPVIVDALAIEAAWDEGRRTLRLPSFSLKGGVTDVALRGELVAPAGDEPWRATLTGRDAVVAGAAAADAPVRITSIDGTLSGREGVRIDALKLQGPALDADISGLVAATADPKALQVKVHARATAVRTALRLWPEAAATPVRQFLVANLRAGVVDRIDLDVAMTGEEIARAMNHKAVPEQAVGINFAVSDATLNAAEGLPPLSRAAVTGTVTGVAARVKASAGRLEMPEGRVLTASDGSFVVEDFWAPASIGALAFRLTGGADAVGALLQAPPLQDIGGVALDPAAIKGRADLRLAVPLPLDAMPKLADLPARVSGTIADLSIDKIAGKERLEGANLAVEYERGGLTIKGEGKLAGSSAVIDVRQSRDSGEAVVAFTLDDAARARAGFAFGPELTGPIPVKGILGLGKTGKAAGTRLEADLSRAAVDGLIPGWQKSAGRPAKLSLTMQEVPDKGIDIKDLQLDAGPVQLRGAAVLGADGGLDKAELQTFKLSPGDDMRAQIERTAGVYKVVVRGNVGDSRPFTRSLNAATPPPPGSRTALKPRDAKDTRDVDLDLAVNILTGYNDEAITNATVKASIRKDSIRQLDVKGRLGATNVAAQTVARGGGVPTILMEAQDAGGVLRFLDIYGRMQGGDLVLQLAAGEGPQSGFVTLRNFTLQNEPALRRIIPTQSQVIAGQDSAGNRQNVRIDVNEVAFTQARVDFTRTAGRLDFKDAAIWGQAIGFTLGGFMDFGRDRVDIAGTFVPAYGLNNAFAQVPLFGPLLGGGRNEGLFAVNFRIAGLATAPTLSVNPLSAVAPGFLRKLFGAGGGDPPTGSVQTIPPPERDNANN